MKSEKPFERTEARGRYGWHGDPATCRPAPSEPNGIVRYGYYADESDRLQRLIAHTGCTITEVIDLGDKGKEAAFLYGPQDDPAVCIGFLKAQGYRINAMTRKRP